MLTIRHAHLQLSSSMLIIFSNHLVLINGMIKSILKNFKNWSLRTLVFLPTSSMVSMNIFGVMRTISHLTKKLSQLSLIPVYKKTNKCNVKYIYH
jgi:hypothetical protein